MKKDIRFEISVSLRQKMDDDRWIRRIGGNSSSLLEGSETRRNGLKSSTRSYHTSKEDSCGERLTSGTGGSKLRLD